MIIRFEYNKTREHVCEMVACADIVKEDKALQRETLDAYTELHQFYSRYFCTGLGEEFARSMQVINNGFPLRILDVGAGRGETSLYLADHGHHVFPVEPSYDFCRVIEYMGLRFNKDLTIYNSSAEYLDIPAEQFDVAIFNASLHHCDEPVKALKNVCRVLCAGGKVFLINEPKLLFYKTYKNWQHLMASDPDKLGHYGGNEHIYYNTQYLSMLKQAGFRNITMEIDASYRSRDSLTRYMEADSSSLGLRQRIKNVYLNLIYYAVRAHLKPLILLMQYLSLMQVTFSATK